MTKILKLMNVVISLTATATLIFVLSYLLPSNLQLPLFFVHAGQESTVTQNDTSKILVPTTISNKAQEMLKNITKNIPTSFVTPAPDDLGGWKKLNKQISSSMPIYGSRLTLDRYQSNITATKLGNVSVLDIKPKDWKDNGKVLVYLHGGGYTFLSANSTLGAAVPVANLTGLRVFSVDYTTAPFSKWNHTTSEVVSVIQALLKKGYSLDDISMYGDSAGGGLVAGSVLRMRDEGIGIPAAIVLWSPWTDVSVSGDSYYTLKKADPLVSDLMMFENMANAYADPSDQKNPYVSPVYGNFSKGFPPTLIQGGTREVLLSDFIRLYQAIDQANVPVKLDIYEGMPHDFQIFLYNTTESSTALAKMNNFLHEYLRF